jgi:hypothetical protein
VRETLTRQRVLETIGAAIASPAAVAHIRRRLAERLGTFSRDISAELHERTARLKRVEERVRGLIVMQADGDRSPMVAQMRAANPRQAQRQ